ncbi:T9SS type A sorting domain-containing protein [Marivirga sp. S37H4]|uniref:T9SS type A sorting domain-containing protein n=1 Tax=Marivirga aurantiaca TaxID=2802615 RepID=A0A934X219_9BACT|nr:T9SS type A sorting domain-containing protein [Marivirga aurantiaca]MBK6266866.1 T9SS type A sorting domain-containing protein [Marivirga aurantiaca]
MTNAQSFFRCSPTLDGNNQLKLSFENEFLGNYKVVIYSLTGGIVSQQSFDKNELKEEAEITLNKIDKGLYMIHITTGGSSIQRKFIV